MMSPSLIPRVDCFSDAVFAGLYGHKDSQDPHCAHSRTGYVIMAFGCPVVWRSYLQTESAVSTMEAEYMVFSTACKDLIPVVAVICKLSNTVGFGDDFVTNLHIKIHKENVGALTHTKLEPDKMIPSSKHYTI